MATLYRKLKAWEDYAQPLALLQLGQPASALHYVPGVREAGPPRFLAAGDAAGGVHLLSPSGRLVLQHHTGAWIRRGLQQAGVDSCACFSASRQSPHLHLKRS